MSQWSPNGSTTRPWRSPYGWAATGNTSRAPVVATDCCACSGSQRVTIIGAGASKTFAAQSVKTTSSR